MKNILTKVCWPILSFFETGEASTNYKKSHRTILIIVSSLFTFLAIISAVMAYKINSVSALIPVIIFFGVALVSIVIAVLGSNGAVSKIWGSNK